VLAAIRERGFGDIIDPSPFPDTALLRVHDEDYLQFLSSAWDEWLADGNTTRNARPFAFVGMGMRHADCRNIHARFGRYSFDTDSPIVAGSWAAIRRSAEVALTGARVIIEGERRAFAVCRPPGHHATQNYCGGYCYLNNAALAAQSMRDAGMARVAILDVDYHHGNGTQTIFYARDDVMTVSLHADPADEYPYFLGFADEPGADAGTGFNHNYPLPLETAWPAYERALSDALQKLAAFSPQALIVSLGLDTFIGDPTTYFRLTTADYARMGKCIATLGVPTLTVLEGGYSVQYIGNNSVSFLEGLLAEEIA
jgi:acetoin utilization deacetylase AcuC-like enzyme